MKRFVVALAALTLGGAAGAAAQGPVLAPLPANPCPGAANLRTTLVANQVGSDTAGLPCGFGGGCAETMVVCFNNDNTGGLPIDIGVELFDFAGVLLGQGFACGVLPGGSAAFVTSGGLAPPYVGTVVAPFAGVPVPLGSLRIVDTRRYAVCDVTLIDTAGTATGVTPPGVPLWTSDVNVVRRTGTQKGE